MPTYTLHNADCLDVMREMGAGSVDAVVTDPPYGIDFDTDYRRFTGGVSKPLFAHARIIGDTIPFDPSPFVGFAKTVILFGANNFSDKLPKGSWLIWDKRSNGKPLMTSDAEAAWLNRGHGVYIFEHVWDGFLRGLEQNSPRVHPTQKPVGLMIQYIERFTKPGDTVFDPFMGSGTTGVACMHTGRNFIGVELDPGYFAIAEARIAKAATMAAGEFVPIVGGESLDDLPLFGGA